MFLGHHQDDNVETTLWRLASGARGSGLVGIPQMAPIPECHGLYGVAESGSAFRLAASREDGLAVALRENGRQGLLLDASTLSPTRLAVHMSCDSPVTDLPASASTTTVSAGGILLCRPLLQFPKADLLATCHENGVPYVSDPTNFDPTLTPRNAIRSLLSSCRLPRALRPSSILSVIKSSRDLVQDSTDLSNQLLARCRILDINLRSGRMVVQFPAEALSPASILATSHRPTKDASERARQIQALTLRRITELLSPFPENHFPLRSFEPFADRVFGPLAASSLGAVSDQFLIRRQSFTLGGVIFQPVRISGEISAADTTVPSTTPAHTHHPPSDHSTNSILPEEKKHPQHTIQTQTTKPSPEQSRNIWLLSRQPFMRHRLPTSRIAVPVPSKSTRQMGPRTPADEQKPLHWSPWTLWDNRYWFRFAIIPAYTEHHQQNHNDDSPSSRPNQEDTTVHLTVRPFQPTDMQRINGRLRLHMKMINTAADTSSKVVSSSSSSHSSAQTDNTSSNFSSSSHHKSDDLSLLQNIKKQLADEAPGLVRFTLPLITLSEQCTDAGAGTCTCTCTGRGRHQNEEYHHGEEERSEQILALPTLQQSPHTDSRSQSGSGSGSGTGGVLSGHFTYAGRPWILTWEWMYKTVDAEVLRRMSS